MTNQEAIKILRRRICCEQPVAHFCDDSCMYNQNKCPISMAIKALEEQDNIRSCHQITMKEMDKKEYERNIHELRRLNNQILASLIKMEEK